MTPTVRRRPTSTHARTAGRRRIPRGADDLRAAPVCHGRPGAGRRGAAGSHGEPAARGTEGQTPGEGVAARQVAVRADGRRPRPRLALRYERVTAVLFPGRPRRGARPRCVHARRLPESALSRSTQAAGTAAGGADGGRPDRGGTGTRRPGHRARRVPGAAVGPQGRRQGRADGPVGDRGAGQSAVRRDPLAGPRPPAHSCAGPERQDTSTDPHGDETGPGHRRPRRPRTPTPLLAHRPPGRQRPEVSPLRSPLSSGSVAGRRTVWCPDCQS